MEKTQNFVFICPFSPIGKESIFCGSHMPFFPFPLFSEMFQTTKVALNCVFSIVTLSFLLVSRHPNYRFKVTFLWCFPKSRPPQVIPQRINLFEHRSLNRITPGLAQGWVGKRADHPRRHF